MKNRNFSLTKLSCALFTCYIFFISQFLCGSSEWIKLVDWRNSILEKISNEPITLNRPLIFYQDHSDHSTFKAKVLDSDLDPSFPEIAHATKLPYPQMIKWLLRFEKIGEGTFSSVYEFPKDGPFVIKFSIVKNRSDFIYKLSEIYLFLSENLINFHCFTVMGTTPTSEIYFLSVLDKFDYTWNSFTPIAMGKYSDIFITEKHVFQFVLRQAITAVEHLQNFFRAGISPNDIKIENLFLKIDKTKDGVEKFSSYIGDVNLARSTRPWLPGRLGSPTGSYLSPFVFDLYLKTFTSTFSKQKEDIFMLGIALLDLQINLFNLKDQSNNFFTSYYHYSQYFDLGYPILRKLGGMQAIDNQQMVVRDVILKALEKYLLDLFADEKDIAIQAKEVFKKMLRYNQLDRYNDGELLLALTSLYGLVVENIRGDHVSPPHSASPGILTTTLSAMLDPAIPEQVSKPAQPK